jgi:hypothetical protein
MELPVVPQLRLPAPLAKTQAGSPGCFKEQVVGATQPATSGTTVPSGGSLVEGAQPICSERQTVPVRALHAEPLTSRTPVTSTHQLKSLMSSTPLEAISATTSRACTSITTRAPHVARSRLVSWPRTCSSNASA